MNKRVVAVSGGFDPLHIGHVRMFEEARKLGDSLVVILNNDNWLTKKKGKPFMQEEERKEIIKALGVVDEVVLTSHSINDPDTSVCRELRLVKPDIFANGGDRKEGNVPEYDVCSELGIEMAFEVGFGGKVQSSSWLTHGKEEEHTKNRFRDDRPWGYFEQFSLNQKSTVKILGVNPGEELSYQYHDYRSEFWHVLDGSGYIILDDKKIVLKAGDEIFIPQGSKHRLGTEKEKIRVLEIAYGHFDEKDIYRLEDKYERNK